MARTVDQIYQSYLAAKNADPILSTQLTSPSLVAIWRLWLYICAFAQSLNETNFDNHKTEVNTIIAAMKPHKLQWYVTMAKAFQYGYILVTDTDTYDNSSLTAAQITASQIVTYAAATEIRGGIRVKVATLSGTDLAPLSDPQLTAFNAYINEVKDSGVRVTGTSGIADSLLLNLNIYYDAQVLDFTGARLDGTENTPVQDAINTFLQNLPFNGVFIPTRLIEVLQNVDGVVIPQVVSSHARYGVLPYTLIDAEYNPDAGYLRLINPATDLVINFLPHERI